MFSSSNFPSSSRPPSPARPPAARLLRMFLASLAGVFAALLILALRSGVEQVIVRRAGDLSARLVLREEVSQAEADALVGRLQAAEEGLEIRLVPAEEIRTALAVQEKWMQHLPEVELAELPALIEVRPGALLTTPGAVQEALERLEQMPEVLFLQFNAVAYRNFLRSSAEMRRAAGWSAAALLAGVGLLLLTGAPVLVHERGARSIPGLIATTAAVTAAGSAAAAGTLGLLFWHIGGQHLELSVPGAPSVVLVTAVAALLQIAGTRQVRTA